VFVFVTLPPCLHDRCPVIRARFPFLSTRDVLSGCFVIAGRFGLSLLLTFWTLPAKDVRSNNRYAELVAGRYQFLKIVNLDLLVGNDIRGHQVRLLTASVGHRLIDGAI